MKHPINKKASFILIFTKKKEEEVKLRKEHPFCRIHSFLPLLAWTAFCFAGPYLPLLVTISKFPLHSTWISCSLSSNKFSPRHQNHIHFTRVQLLFANELVNKHRHYTKRVLCKNPPSRTPSLLVLIKSCFLFSRCSVFLKFKTLSWRCQIQSIHHRRRT
jgi:hypothetical protein